MVLSTLPIKRHCNLSGLCSSRNDTERGRFIIMASILCANASKLGRCKWASRLHEWRYNVYFRCKLRWSPDPLRCARPLRWLLRKKSLRILRLEALRKKRVLAKKEEQFFMPKWLKGPHWGGPGCSCWDVYTEWITIESQNKYWHGFQKMERESADDQESAGVTHRQSTCKISRWHGITLERSRLTDRSLWKRCIGQRATASGQTKV